MQKAAPNFGRIALMVGFALSCFGLVLFLWLAFGGPVPLKPKGYRVSASFAEASQLATEADVRISGVPVGKVKTIEPDAQTGRSLVTFELDAKYAPLPSDAKAILRQKTLLGETYVELTPGTDGARKVPEGGRLPEGAVSETVELDEILRTFDPETRAAFREWTQTQAEAIAGRGRDINDALGNLGPFAEDAAELVDILNRQEPAVRRLISDTGVVFDALTERDGQLRELIENSNTVFATTASRDRELQGGVHRAADLRARVARDDRAADRVRRRHRPARHAAAPGRARAVADADRPLGARARPQGLLPRARPADRRVARPASRRPSGCSRTSARCSRRSTRRCASSTRCSTTSASTSASSRRSSPTRWRRRRRPRSRARARSTTCARRTRSTPRTSPCIRRACRRTARTRTCCPTTSTSCAPGLPSYETRHCDNGPLPSISNVAQQVVPPTLPPLSLPVEVPPLLPDAGVVDGLFSYPDALIADIIKFGFPGGAGVPGVAPPCTQQPKFDVSGEQTQFPHLKPAP